MRAAWSPNRDLKALVTFRDEPKTSDPDVSKTVLNYIEIFWVGLPCQLVIPTFRWHRAVPERQ